MIQRLLFAAVAMCILGALPDKTERRRMAARADAPPVTARATAATLTQR